MGDSGFTTKLNNESYVFQLWNPCYWDKQQIRGNTEHTVMSLLEAPYLIEKPLNGFASCHKIDASNKTWRNPYTNT